MFYSIYPTDEKRVQEEIVSQVLRYGVTHLFTSLHIPEAKEMHDFLRELKALHRKHGFTYTADVGPETVELLGVSFTDLRLLMDVGITGLRLDYGIEWDVMQSLFRQGFALSMNGSTITEELFEEWNRAGDCDQTKEIVGWHNYYPRPFTGISATFFQSLRVRFPAACCVTSFALTVEYVKL